MITIKKCVPIFTRCGYCGTEYMCNKPKHYRKVRWSDVGKYGKLKCKCCKNWIYIEGADR